MIYKFLLEFISNLIARASSIFGLNILNFQGLPANKYNSTKHTIGIVGVGVVGSAMEKIFTNKNIFVKTYDKYKELKDKQEFEEDTLSLAKLIDCNFIFLCLPTPFINNQDNKLLNSESEYECGYNKNEIYQTIDQLNNLNYNGLIIIKSTVEPGVTRKLQMEYSKLNIIHNPEFLTARTAAFDFDNQNHIVLGIPLFSSIDENTNYFNLLNEKVKEILRFYKYYFPNSDISICSSDESELMKMTCNAFYATKIQFFTEIKLFCDSINISYDKLRILMNKNGWINPMHTEIPGHDGKISFGGMCLPKDTNSLCVMMLKNNTSNLVISAVLEEHKKMRACE